MMTPLAEPLSVGIPVAGACTPHSHTVSQGALPYIFANASYHVLESKPNTHTATELVTQESL